MIAQDTIARIKTKNIAARTGNLLRFDSSIIENNKGIKEAINKPKDYPSCTVCAKGGLFCSLIGRVNKLTFDDIKEHGQFEQEDFKNKKDAHYHLVKIFTPMQLDLIEIAFEGESYMKQYKDDSLKLKAIDFHSQYANKNVDDLPIDRVDNNKLLIKICENIIKNKGTFKP